MSRLAVDWTRCDGHGLCAAVAPELVGTDEWGYPLVEGSVGDDDRRARRAVLACPVLALRLEPEPEAAPGAISAGGRRPPGRPTPTPPER